MAEVVRVLWLLGFSHSEIRLAIHALITGLALGGFLVAIWRAARNERLTVDLAERGDIQDPERGSRRE